MSRIAQRRAVARSEGSPAYVKRREEIITAAAKVFNEKGYGGANLADVAAELGADRASMYYYFGSKQELFRYVVRDAVEANVTLVEGLRDADLPSEEKLAGVLRGLMASYEENYPYLYVYIQEDMVQLTNGDSSWAKETRSLNTRFTDALVAIVQQGIDDGSLRPLAPAAVLASGVLGMVNWTHRWFKPSGRVTAGEVGDAYVALAMDGLRA